MPLGENPTNEAKHEAHRQEKPKLLAVLIVESFPPQGRISQNILSQPFRNILCNTLQLLELVSLILRNTCGSVRSSEALPVKQLCTFSIASKQSIASLKSSCLAEGPSGEALRELSWCLTSACQQAYSVEETGLP